ncbi:unnamed protein product [Linum trigynum]|uniref:Uncharacterized protein n=1 Tax=Linum trigynum TaxID=586398 RepID=A0AAV2FC86_9ROSI
MGIVRREGRVPAELSMGAGSHRPQRQTTLHHGDEEDCEHCKGGRGEVAATERMCWLAATSRWRSKGLAAAPLWFVVVAALRRGEERTKAKSRLAKKQGGGVFNFARLGQVN